MRDVAILMRGVAIVVVTAALASGCAANTRTVDLGSGVWVMTRTSGFLVQKADELKAQVEQDALAFCKRQGVGSALAVLDSRAIEPDPPEPAHGIVEFRCVGADSTSHERPGP